MIDMQSSINPDDEQISRVRNIICTATGVSLSRRKLCDIIRAILITRPPLTLSEDRALCVLIEHYESERFAMTIRGLQAALGSRSLGHVHNVVVGLCDKGYVIQLANKYVPVGAIGLLKTTL